MLLRRAAGVARVEMLRHRGDVREAIEILVSLAEKHLARRQRREANRHDRQADTSAAKA